MEYGNDRNYGMRDIYFKSILPPFHCSNIPEILILGAMKKYSSTAITFFILLWSLPGCQQVQKPEVRGSGPLSIVMERGTVAPEYHAPLERWRATHKKALKNGDFSERECVLCHNPQKSCDLCHGYIGAKEIKISEAILYWPTKGATPDRAPAARKMGDPSIR